MLFTVKSLSFREDGLNFMVSDSTNATPRITNICPPDSKSWLSPLQERPRLRKKLDKLPITIE